MKEEKKDGRDGERIERRDGRKREGGERGRIIMIRRTHTARQTGGRGTDRRKIEGRQGKRRERIEPRIYTRKGRTVRRQAENQTGGYRQQARSTYR